MKPKVIYTLTAPGSDVVEYVGATINRLNDRLYVHLWTAKRAPDRKVCKWLNSLGIAPEIKVIEIVPPEVDWEAREQFWISHFRDINPELKNESLGGKGGSLGVIKTEETRKALSRRLKGRIHSEEHCRAISEGKKGTVISAEHRAKLSRALKGRFVSDKTRRLMSAAKRDVPCPPLRGEGNGRAKLTVEQVSLIRSGEVNEKTVKRDWGLSRTQYYRIKRGEQWNLIQN